MKTPLLFVSAALIAAAAAFPALASSDSDSTDSCRNVAKADWMSEEAAKAKAAGQGLNVKNLKVEDGCYEIYAIDKDGKRVEAYMHPGNGNIVKMKYDD